MRTPCLFAVLALIGAGERLASAQSFPPERSWHPFYCGDEVMFDAVDDEVDAIDERDVVGDVREPAGLRAADDDFLYLRLRLDRDPVTGAVLTPFTWGMEFDLDLDPTNYEVLILADGVAGEVNLFENTVIELENDPSDPADEPPVATYAIEDASESAETDDQSDFGGTEDRFIDIAVPWDDLAPLGLAPDSDIGVWVASSSSQISLDGDFACHDGGSGAPSLDEVMSDRTVADPDLDSDGDGFADAEEIAEGSDPDDPEDVPPDQAGPGEPRLEGGGGCAAGGGGASDTAALLALALLPLAFRARRASVSRARRAS
jgi:hypothetical protein